MYPVFSIVFCTDFNLLLICSAFSTTTNNIQPRATRMLSSILQNDKVALACHYGAIGGLAELGPEVILIRF